MLRLIFLLALGAIPAGAAVPAKPGGPATNSPPLSAEAELLIRHYRMDDRMEAKVDALRSLGRREESRLAGFLEREYEKLDTTIPDDARLAGVILQAWAARPSPVSVSYLIYEGLFQEDPAVVRDCAEGIGRMPADARSLLSTGRAAAGRDPSDEIALDLISRLMQKPEVFYALEKVLMIWSGKSRTGFTAPNTLAKLPDPETRQAGIDFWKNWFEQQFHQKFAPVFDKSPPEKSDEEIYKFLLNEPFQEGDAARGARVFASLRCNICHAGGATNGIAKRLLGPDLHGVTKRLTRTELAEALVYPSRRVSAPFKAVAITLKDSVVLKGYITEQNDRILMLAGRAKLRRVDRSAVATMEPQAESLMPGRLLSHAHGEEMRDLLKYLDSLPQGKTDR